MSLTATPNVTNVTPAYWLDCWFKLWFSDGEWQCGSRLEWNVGDGEWCEGCKLSGNGDTGLWVGEGWVKAREWGEYREALVDLWVERHRAKGVSDDR